MPTSVDYQKAQLDIHHSMAIRDIYNSYGHMVSLTDKSKSLAKFGRRDGVAASTKTTVATFGTGINSETLAVGNTINAMISSSASDTEVMVVEGHTQDAEGNLTFVVQSKQLQGQTSVELDTPLARCTRAYVANGTFASPSSDLVGTVYFYDDTDGDDGSGVPTTASAVKLAVVAGKNQSEKCATSISKDDYWLLDGAVMSIGRATASSVSVDFDIEVRQLGGVWRPVGMEVSLRATAETCFRLPFEPLVIIPPNSDVRMVAVASNTANVSGRMRGHLAKIIR